MPALMKETDARSKIEEAIIGFFDFFASCATTYGTCLRPNARQVLDSTKTQMEAVPYLVALSGLGFAVLSTMAEPRFFDETFILHVWNQVSALKLGTVLIAAIIPVAVVAAFSSACRHVLEFTGSSESSLYVFQIGAYCLGTQIATSAIAIVLLGIAQWSMFSPDTSIGLAIFGITLFLLAVAVFFAAIGYSPWVFSCDPISAPETTKKRLARCAVSTLPFASIIMLLFWAEGLSSSLRPDITSARYYARDHLLEFDMLIDNRHRYPMTILTRDARVEFGDGLEASAIVVNLNNKEKAYVRIGPGEAGEVGCQVSLPKGAFETQLRGLNQEGFVVAFLLDAAGGISLNGGRHYIGPIRIPFSSIEEFESGVDDSLTGHIDSSLRD